MVYVENLGLAIIGLVMFILFALSWRAFNNEKNKRLNMLADHLIHEKDSSIIKTECIVLRSEKSHLQKMLNMYEEKEGVHAKMIEKLTEDHADLAVLKSLWAVFLNMEAVMGTESHSKAVKALGVLNKIKFDITYVLHDRRKEKKLVLDDRGDELITEDN